jgi:hypothetical protein
VVAWHLDDLMLNTATGILELCTFTNVLWAKMGQRGERKPQASPQLTGSCGAGGADGGRRGRIGGEKSNLTRVFGCRVRAV